MFKISFEISHHRKFFDCFTKETCFSNLFLTNRAIPPDSRQALLEFGTAVSETLPAWSQIFEHNL